MAINPDGTVFIIGGQQRAHVAGENHRAIGVCVVGDFTAREPSPELYETIRQTVKWLLELWPEAVVVPHRGLTATQCPGLIDIERLK